MPPWKPCALRYAIGRPPIRVGSDEAPSTAIDRGDSNGVRPEKREAASGMAADIPPWLRDGFCRFGEAASVAGGRRAVNLLPGGAPATVTLRVERTEFACRVWPGCGLSSGTNRNGGAGRRPAPCVRLGACVRKGQEGPVATAGAIAHCCMTGPNG